MSNLSTKKKKFLFVFGNRRMGKYWLVMTFKRGERSWWIGARCVKGIWSRWITCCFTFSLLGHFWELAFSCLGISWVSDNSISNHILAGKGYFDRKAKKKILALLPVSFWSIWRERNQRVFKGDEISFELLKYIFIKTLHFWDKENFCMPGWSCG